MAIDTIEKKGVNVAQAEFKTETKKDCPSCLNQRSDLCGPCIAPGNDKMCFEPLGNIILPKFRVCEAVCRYFLSDLCPRCLAPQGRSWFELKRDVTIDDWPETKLEEIREMKADMKLAYLANCETLIVARLQGVK